ncbi:MAG: hypothetical protein AAFY82_00145 [Pseudomonadota bacterium]
MMEDIGDLQELISSVSEGDFATPGEEETLLQKAFNRDANMAGKIAQLFVSPEGKEVLEWLCAHTVRRPVLDFEARSTLSPEKAMALTYYREGENEVVWRILLTIRDFETAMRGGQDADDDDD